MSSSVRPFNRWEKRYIAAWLFVNHFPRPAQLRYRGVRKLFDYDMLKMTRRERSNALAFVRRIQETLVNE